MLNELLCNQLEVVLIPAPEQKHSGHCVRAVQYTNPIWYQKFCKEHPSNCKKKRFQTRIRRKQTIEALRRIIKGETGGIYVERIVEFINQQDKKLLPSVAIESELNEEEYEKVLF